MLSHESVNYGCPLPSTFLRRFNSVWSCPGCNTLWSLRRESNFNGDVKVWEKVLDGVR